MAEKTHRMTEDECMVINGLLDDVYAERRRQLEMWGQQDHPVTFNAGHWDYENTLWHERNDDRVEQNTLTWDGILMEEVAEALMETDLHQQRKEFIEVAAVAIAAAEAVDRKIAAVRVSEPLADWERELLAPLEGGEVDYETGRKVGCDAEDLYREPRAICDGCEVDDHGDSIDSSFAMALDDFLSERAEVSIELKPDGTMWASGPASEIVRVISGLKVLD